MAEEKPKDYEIRSEEMEDILGKAPRNIVRYGITVIFSVILIVIIGSWFFKYPDVINSPVVITSENIPLTLVAKNTGKISRLFVTDGEIVSKGSPLALIENNASYEQITNLTEQLQLITPHTSDNTSNISIDTITLKSYNQLGDVQQTFAGFAKALNEIRNFNALNYHHQKIKAVKEQIDMTNLFYERQYAQRNLLEKDLLLIQNQYRRDSSLFSNKVISASEFEKSESIFLQKKFTVEGIRTALANTRIQLTQLQQQILDLQLQYQEQSKKAAQIYSQAYDELINQLHTWQQTFLLMSNIDGKVSFTKFWSENQQVNQNDKVLSVIPNGKTRIFGKLSLNIDGAGKVKPGQKVNIQLAAYPSAEYGTINANVKSISLISSDNNYSVELELTDSLKTNYGIPIEMKSELQGTAEIITDDIRLLQRFLNPIKSLIRKQK